MVVLALVLVVAVDHAATTTVTKRGRYFDRVFIILLENQGYQDAIRNQKFKELAQNGTVLTNYFAVTHPSQPNYLAMTSGDTWTDSDDNINVDATNIVDLLEAKNISWKSYEENFPSRCFTGASKGKYYRKHNPLISYDNVRNNANRCAKIVNANELLTDIKSNTVPQYCFYTPNIDHDGHNTGLSGGADWVYSFLPPLMQEPHFTDGTLVVITYDEDNYKDQNQVFTLLMGSMVTSGAQDSHHYTHYSLLRTIEENWSLGSLQRNDATANVFQSFH